ncbi:MAG: pitrilysin family protein [Anaerolineae bacterium]|nr:insulinase family protein [Anaerolineae bacterium]MCX8066370.1 insulinase family protein [Anaerolineae bacterium]MDW7991779.1 pitrilysin family protein [Anaerolineae bacterium]
MSIPGPHDILRQELSNGIVVLVRENHTSPSVVVSGYLEVGSRDEPPEKAGLADFTASALSRGTVRRTFDQIYEEVESVGASFGISAGVSRTIFGAKSLAEDLPRILDVLADVLRNPTFPPKEVEKLRGEILTDLEERAHDTRRMASLTFRELAYPDHPYGRSVDGYIETVSPLTADDLAEFYHARYTPRGMVIAIVGAVRAEDAVRLVGEAFGDWEGPVPDRPPLPPVAPPAEVREKFVPIPGKTQTDIVLGWPGPARTDPAFLDAVVCNTILGVFGMMGRLGDKVRDEMGLAYYSYSRVEGGIGPGPWTVIAGVNPVNVPKALEAILSEIRRIREEMVPPGELADSQAFLVGSLPLRLETNEGVAGAILDMERYRLGLDYLQRYGDLIREITPERVQAVAQRWLNPDAYVLALAGPPGE